jgi:hypothetical protein
MSTEPAMTSHFAVWGTHDASRAAVKSARASAAALSRRADPVRQERLSGIHNPWGVGATLTDPWTFLDLCENSELANAVARIAGPDLILWDSELFLDAERYRRFATAEGRHWPIEPLAGAVAGVPLDDPDRAQIVAVPDGGQLDLSILSSGQPLYVIRYMRATSHFNRDSSARANRRVMEERLLVNYSTRPLWLIKGEDRANNDFITGFAPVTPRWAGPLAKGK